MLFSLGWGLGPRCAPPTSPLVFILLAKQKHPQPLERQQKYCQQACRSQRDAHSENAQQMCHPHRASADSNWDLLKWYTPHPWVEAPAALNIWSLVCSICLKREIFPFNSGGRVGHSELQSKLHPKQLTEQSSCQGLRQILLEVGIRALTDLVFWDQ